MNRRDVRNILIVFLSQLLKGLSLSLLDQQSRKDAQQHEQGVDLQHVVEPRALVVLGRTSGPERGDGTLADDGADLARGGRDSVGRGPVACREALSGDDKGGRVGAKVEEELRQDIDGQQAVVAQFIVGEAHDDEEDREDYEATELDGLAAYGVDRRDGDPVTGDSTSQDDD